MDIKILVAAHKPYWMPDDDVYLPIQVGAAGKGSLGWRRDDEGDNISEKNPNYCELTALYWAWKNLNADYIGLCHYRRYFAFHTLLARMKKKKHRILKRKNYETVLNHYDIIVPKTKSFGKLCVWEQYANCHHINDLEQVKEILFGLYPEYRYAFSTVMKRHSLHCYNMFVMRKDLFQRYCQWLFSILFELEKEIDISKYDTYQARVYGFLSERLFNVWIEHQHLKICEVPVTMIRDPAPKPKWYKRILYKISNNLD